MEQPNTSLELPEELEPASVVLTEEESEALLCDCFTFIESILDRKNPAWLQSDALKLRTRLVEVLSWYKIH